MKEKVCVDRIGCRGCEKKVCVDRIGSRGVQQRNHGRPETRLRGILIFRGVVVGVAKANNYTDIAIYCSCDTLHALHSEIAL